MPPLHFLFAAAPQSTSRPDAMFADQQGAIAAAGFTTSILPDNTLATGRLLRYVPRSAIVVYRGWMLNADDYARLNDAVQAVGARLLTTPANYLAAHHLPRWYPALSDLTSETRFLGDPQTWDATLGNLNWNGYFVKDFVKSLKTERGSIAQNANELREIVAEMQQFRGEIEGGICIRRVEHYRPDSERRFFAISGRAFSADGVDPPPIAAEVARRLALPFISIDVAAALDGSLRVVEVGDGQVTDLVGWSPSRFAELWQSVPTDA